VSFFNLSTHFIYYFEIKKGAVPGPLLVLFSISLWQNYTGNNPLDRSTFCLELPHRPFARLCQRICWAKYGFGRKASISICTQQFEYPATPPAGFLSVSALKPCCVCSHGSPSPNQPLNLLDASRLTTL
jgi:hypothetical protein